MLSLYAVLLHVILLQSSLGYCLQDWHLDHNSGVLYPAGAFHLVGCDTGRPHAADVPAKALVTMMMVNWEKPDEAEQIRSRKDS